MTRLVIVVTACVAWAGCSCGASIAPDAGHDAATVDTDVDAGPCNPVPPTCRTQATCDAWAARAAPPGTYGIATCGSSRCGTGNIDCGNIGGATHCYCDVGLICSSGEACVSDTPGGQGRCAIACEGR